MNCLDEVGDIKFVAAVGLTGHLPREAAKAGAISAGSPIGHAPLLTGTECKYFFFRLSPNITSCHNHIEDFSSRIEKHHQLSWYHRDYCM